MQTRVFSAMSSSERKLFAMRYRSFLVDRDGTPNFASGTLSRREQFLSSLANELVQRTGPAVVEQSVYTVNVVERDIAEEGLDRWTLWAICLTKCSRMEEYAVRYLDETGRRRNADPQDPYCIIDLEERYHGRLLSALLTVVGIETKWRPPRFLTRLTLRAILAVPRAISNITVLCGEVIGVAIFKLFLETGRTLCEDQPRASAQLTSLLQEILIDEIGHVLFLHSQLGPIRLRISRLLLPIIARALIADYPEVLRLFGKRLLNDILDPQLLQNALDEVGGMPALIGRPAIAAAQASPESHLA